MNGGRKGRKEGKEGRKKKTSILDDPRGTKRTSVTEGWVRCAWYTDIVWNG